MRAAGSHTRNRRVHGEHAGRPKNGGWEPYRFRLNQDRALVFCSDALKPAAILPSIAYQRFR